MPCLKKFSSTRNELHHFNWHSFKKVPLKEPIYYTGNKPQNLEQST